MEKLSNKINYDLAIKLIDRIDELTNEESFYEAFILQTAVVEYLLRIFIKLNVPNEGEYHKYHDASQFSILINYFLLLGGEIAVYKKLEDYRTMRNKLVHKILEYESLESFTGTVRKIFKLGEEIIYNISLKEPFAGILNNARKKYNLRQNIEMSSLNDKNLI